MDARRWLVPGGVLLLIMLGAAWSAAATPASAPGDLAPVRARLDSLWTSGHHDAFRDTLREEIARAAARGDTASTIRLLSIGGARDVSVGQAIAAEQTLRRGLALARATRDTSGEVPTLRWLGVALGLQGRFDEAAATCGELLVLARATGDRRHEGWAHVGIAWASLQRGGVDEAQREYEVARQDLRAAGDAEGEIWASNGLAMTRSRRGDLRGALAAYQDLAERAKELGYPMAEALAVNNAGHCQYLIGDPGQAQVSFERARRLQTDLGQDREALVPMLNLALCLADLGQVDAAGDTLELCLDRSLARGYVDLAGEAIVEQANLERRAGHPHAAVATVRRALALDARLAAQDRGRATVALALALADLDSAGAALACLDRLRAGVPEASLGAVGSDLALARARALAETGESSAAMAVLDGVIAAATTSGDDRTRMLACLQQGRLLAAGGRGREARATLAQGLAAWERERSLPVQPQWREHRGNAGHELAMALAEVMLDAGGPTALADAYRVVQAFKARTLIERRLGPGVSVPPAVATIALDSLRTCVLREGECLLDLYLGEDRGLLFAIAPDTVAVFRLALPGNIESRVNSLRLLLNAPPATPSAGARIQVLRAAVAGLRADLLGPAAAVISGRRHVILAADGIAHTLPLEAWADTLTGSPTIWSRTPSAVVLARIRSDREPPPITPGTPLVLVADASLPDGRALPGVRREERQLQQRFDGAVRLAGLHLRDMYATASVVHVAGHAEVDDQAPWRSAVMVREGPQEDVWRADAIASMPTSAGLVVLSSCSTAQGRVLSGEGLVGLSSAFLAGGAHAVIATLWPIDDAAGAAFMDLFYRNLALCGGAGESLARARAGMQHSRIWTDPFYWAGYVVIGDGALRVGVPGDRQTADHRAGRSTSSR